MAAPDGGSSVCAGAEGHDAVATLDDLDVEVHRLTRSQPLQERAVRDLLDAHNLMLVLRHTCFLKILLATLRSLTSATLRA